METLKFEIFDNYLKLIALGISLFVFLSILDKKSVDLYPIIYGIQFRNHVKIF
jgi:hypothetical protein